MGSLRLEVQRLIKGAGRAMGLEIRYSFQNPSISEPGVYARWFSPEAVKCVFDVGANTGQSASKFLATFPNATIHSFEPFPSPFAQLETVASASAGRVHAHRLGCSDQEEAVDVAVGPEPSSQLNQLPGATNPPAPGGSGSTVRINTVRVDRFCEARNIDFINLLKTDTEGYDGRVLAGAEGMLSKARVKCVVTEVGFLDDQQHTAFKTVFNLLSQFGYEFAGPYEVTYHKHLACDFANALFVHPTAAR